MHKNLTVYDIAAEANVSVATVSRVLNNNEKVAESTRKKVQDLIDKYEFKPNEVARSLYKNETKLIGCILPDITNPYYSTVLLESEKYALSNGYTIVVCNTLGNPINSIKYFQTLIERQVDGIIYMGGEQDISMDLIKLIKRYEERLPIVTINWDLEDVNCYSVKSDETQGFQIILDKIIEKGYRDVALLAGTRGVMPTELKVSLYQEAVRSGLLNQHDNYIIDGDFSVDHGITGMLKLLSLPVKPQVVIGINDIIAVGALNACYMKNICVPEEVRIIGFDNIKITGAVYPSLTTVAHDYFNISRKAVDIILDKTVLLKEKKTYTYPMQMICRESF